MAAVRRGRLGWQGWECGRRGRQGWRRPIATARQRKSTRTHHRELPAAKYPRHIFLLHNGCITTATHDPTAEAALVNHGLGDGRGNTCSESDIPNKSPPKTGAQTSSRARETKIAQRLEKLLATLEIHADAIGARLIELLQNPNGGGTNWEREVRALSTLARTFEKLVDLSQTLQRKTSESKDQTPSHGNKHSRAKAAAIRQEILRRLDRIASG